VGASLSVVATGPPPVLQVDLDDTFHPQVPRVDWFGLFKAVDDAGVGLTFVDLASCQFRGVPFERFGRVIATGIDIEPTTAHVYVDGFDKALEYGDWPKVVLALKNDALRHTGRRVRSDISPAELSALRQEYQTTRRSDDGQWLWLSRLPKDSTAVGTAYEMDYARWIPGNPKEALRAVFVLTHPSVETPPLQFP
jgi:hypothetical protein